MGMTLSSGQTLNLTADQYQDNSAALAKIVNPVADYAVNVTGATSANALVIAHNANVDQVTLTSLQSFHLSPTDFNSALTDFGKITNAASDYTVTLDVSNATQNADIASIVANNNTGGYIDVIDLASNAISITDAQASSLVLEGIHFATDDTGIAVQAVGTHLTTSLSDLQKLGVDVVNVGLTLGEFVIAAGTGVIDFAHLPTVVAAAGVAVSLEMTDASIHGLSAADMQVEAQALQAAGFNELRMADGLLTVDSSIVNALHDAGMSFASQDQITMTVASGTQQADIAALVSNIDSHANPRSDVDVIDLASNALTLTDAQAASLVSAGIHFATDDTGIAVQAVGTHLTTSLSDLQKLGVDYVHTDANAVNTVVLDMGTGTLSSATLPVFDATDRVQLNVLDSQLSSLETVITANANAAHIDVLSVVLNDAFGTELSGLGVLDTSLHSNGLSVQLNAAFANTAVTLGMVLDAADGSADPLALLHGQTLADALVDAGITDIKIDQITSFEVADTDLKPLMDAGLITADAGANITVDHTGVGTLDVTLAQLAAMGADQVVQTGGASLTVDAGVTFSDLTGLESELSQLLTHFEDPISGVINKQLFVDANTVDLHVAGTLANGDVLSTALAAQLTLLGIDHVLDDEGHTLK